MSKKIDDDIEKFDIDSPLLGKYISRFLDNANTAKNQGDDRILFYRGQSNSEFSLTPAVFRNGLLEKEHKLIKDLLLNSPAEFNNIQNNLERLIKMQHYGLPTRLLDITSNPLVALFFACNQNPNKDGELFIFYDYIQRANDINSKCIVELTEYTGSSERQMIGFLSDRGFNNLELGKLTTTTHILIEAPKNNERIKRQQGAFLLVGLCGQAGSNPYQKERFDLKPLLTRDMGDDVKRTICIPKEHKQQLLQELEILGISHAFLFPELEHQASYLRKKHEEV